MLKTTGHCNKFEMKKTWRTLMGMAVGLFCLILPILFKISTYDFIYRKSLQFCDNCEYKRNHSKMFPIVYRNVVISTTNTLPPDTTFISE